MKRGVNECVNVGVVMCHVGFCEGVLTSGGNSFADHYRSIALPEQCTHMNTCMIPMIRTKWTACVHVPARCSRCCNVLIVMCAVLSSSTVW